MASPDKATQLPFTAHSLFTGQTDERITRLSKVLSTSSGVDATLHLVGYGLFLISSQLSKLETLELKALTNPNASISTLKYGPVSLVKLAEVNASSKVVAGLCSDFRAFTRLWGLLGVYAMAKRNYVEPPQDVILRAVSYAQTAAIGAYYVYENGYYLAGKGVLRGWLPGDVKRWAKRSLRCFLAYVLFEFVRLYRVRRLREGRKMRAVDEEEVERIRGEEKAWGRSVVLNVAYTPLCLHWASEEGMLSDTVVGALMSYIGVMKFKAAWAQTG